jgi:ABC-type lipoprotein export system ATPase subunit
MIEAKNLRKKYSPKKGVEVHALDNVSVRLPDTGMVFVLGKSGSGKSTLLNVLGGLDTIDSGEIFIKGQSSKEFKQSHFDSYRNTYVGFIFQEYNILEEFTVGANIALAIELQGRKATNE